MATFLKGFYRGGIRANNLYFRQHLAGIYTMKKYIFFLSALFIAGCGNPGENSSYHPEAKGGRVYGGTLRVNESDPYITLFPHNISVGRLLN